MPMTVRHEGGNVYRLEVHGTLSKLELERGQNVLIDDLGRVGPVRLLFLLEGFEGWAPDDDWHDLTFYVKYGDAIERIAIVGDEKWRSQSLMFAGADLRKGPVEFFSPGPATCWTARVPISRKFCWPHSEICLPACATDATKKAGFEPWHVRAA